MLQRAANPCRRRGPLTSRAPEFYSAGELLELLSRESPLVRAWAVRALARSAPKAFQAAAPRLLRERHPDVLRAVIDWCGRAEPQAGLELLALARALRKAKLPSRIPAGAAWRLVPQAAPHEEWVRLRELSPRVAKVLPALTAAAGERLQAAIRDLLAGDADGEFSQELTFLGPEDSERGADWRLATASYGPDERRWQRWNYCFALLPASPDLPWEPPPPADLTGAPEALERAAARLVAACAEPAASAPEPAAGAFRKALVSRARAASAFARALGTRLGSSPVPDSGRLKLGVDALWSWLSDALGGAKAFAAAGEPLEALLSASASCCPPDEGLAAALAEAGGAALARRLRDGLDKLEGAARARAYDVIGRIEGLEAAELLAKGVGSEDALVRDACLDRLEQLGPGVLDRLGPYFDQAEAEALSWLMDALETLPGEATGRAFARRAERLWTQLENWEVEPGLLATGSVAALEALRDAYRPGERALGEAVLTLAELHGLELPELPALRAERSRAIKAFAGDHADRPVEAALRCLACRRQYHYEVSEFRLAMDAVKEGKAIAEGLSFDVLIRCKRCGAVEQFEPSYDLVSELEEAAEEASERLQEGELPLPDEDGGVRLGRLVLCEAIATAGRTFLSAGAALRWLERETRARPKDAGLWLSLGNVYKNGGLLDLSEAPFKRAIEADPRELEAHLGLAEALWWRGDARAAHPHYQAVLGLAGGSKIDKDALWELVRHALDCLAGIRRETRLPILPDAMGGPTLDALGGEALEDALDAAAERCCGMEGERS